MTPVRFSHLKWMARSPAHYKAYLDAPMRETLSMRLGSAVDGYLLASAPAVYDGTRRGKAWEAFEAANPGRLILTETENAVALRMVDALSSHPQAMALLQGQRQHEVNWSFCGRTCSSHLDVLGDGFITDLKTTNCAEPEKFGRAALRYAYNAQLAFYAEAIEATTGKRPRDLYLVAVESSEPHPVTIHRLTPRAVDMGIRLCRSWMERLLVCEASNVWPGYCENIVDLDVPEEVELTFGEEQEAA